MSKRSTKKTVGKVDLKKNKIEILDDFKDEDNSIKVKVENKFSSSKKNKNNIKFDLEDLKLKSRKSSALKGTNKVILILVCIVIILSGIYYLMLPKIELKGNKEIKIEYSSMYTEKGYIAKHLGKDVTDKVVVKDNINHKLYFVY